VCRIIRHADPAAAVTATLYSYEHVPEDPDCTSLAPSGEWSPAAS
jgi:hypothetical protein